MIELVLLIPLPNRKNAFYDHDFTTEAIVLGNQSVRDRRLIGIAVIIITERTGSY